MGSLIGQAYCKAFTKENIEKGFKVPGICPLNENIFNNEEFMSSYVTDRPLSEEVSTQVNTPVVFVVTESPVTSVSEVRPVVYSPVTSSKEISEPLTDLRRPSISGLNKTILTPEIIRPFPKAGARKKLLVGDSLVEQEFLQILTKK
ncbi:hypothetical protein J6590_068657 [Homalodisca vitripennis]|nr:hypothetical protein J6590_068657 [Homalodisca vitripennis]